MTARAWATGPWLCDVHARAGGSVDPPCCRDALPVRPPERGLWYAMRLAGKPAAVRNAIQIAVYDRGWSLAVLAAHAFDRGRTWSWGSGPDGEGAPVRPAIEHRPAPPGGG